MVACVVLLVLAAQALGANAFYDDDSPRVRMADGDAVTDPDAYGFQAAIQPIASPGSNVTLGVCSGVIIRGLGVDTTNATNATNATAYVDKYFILTAASCVLPGTSCNIYLGTNEVRADATPDLLGVTAADMVIHPEFLTTGMLRSDLAILTADKITTVFNAKKLVAALLPSIDDAEASYLASAVSLTAWGSPEDRKSAITTASVDETPASSVLRQVDTRVWPNLFCTVFHLDKQITRNHLCAGGLVHGGPCTGDAGAPLIMRAAAGRPRVVGLATLLPVNGCGRGKPGVFTRLSSYLVWIMQITNYDPYQ